MKFYCLIFFNLYFLLVVGIEIHKRLYIILKSFPLQGQKFQRLYLILMYFIYFPSVFQNPILRFEIKIWAKINTYIFKPNTPLTLEFLMLGNVKRIIFCYKYFPPDFFLTKLLFITSLPLSKIWDPSLFLVLVSLPCYSVHFLYFHSYLIVVYNIKIIFVYLINIPLSFFVFVF